MRHQTHQQNPKKKSVHLILCYKNFAACHGISHIGLGVAARNTAAVLRRQGFRVEVWPINTIHDLTTRLEQSRIETLRSNEHPITHVVISAAWLPTKDLSALVMQHPEIVWSVSSHSNVGFLQADPGGMAILRDTYNMAVGLHNFRSSGNCKRYTSWVHSTYEVPCWFLPNLYDLISHSKHPYKRPWNGGAVRIGLFGAPRILKNLGTAVAGALEARWQLSADMEIHLSCGRDENATVLSVIRSMMKDMIRVKLVQHNWQTWPEFRRLIGQMDLILQPSYTESFNMVVADGISEGVAAVTSTAIDWVPVDWKADSDNANDIGSKIVHLLQNPLAPAHGLRALEEYIANGIPFWERFLLTGV